MTVRPPSNPLYSLPLWLAYELKAWSRRSDKQPSGADSSIDSELPTLISDAIVAPNESDSPLPPGSSVDRSPDGPRMGVAEETAGANQPALISVDNAGLPSNVSEVAADGTGTLPVLTETLAIPGASNPAPTIKTSVGPDGPVTEGSSVTISAEPTTNVSAPTSAGSTELEDVTEAVLPAVSVPDKAMAAAVDPMPANWDVARPKTVADATVASPVPTSDMQEGDNAESQETSVDSADRAVLVGVALPADEDIDNSYSVTPTQVDTSEIALGVPAAVSEYHAATGGTLNGAGLTIGILSDSFNVNGGEASDIAAGLLPPADQINILQEGPPGSTDEGRAMAQLIYAIAPGATIDFYSAEGGEASMAAGIAALEAAGANVIVDDVIYTAEPFFQNTGPITEAAEAAVAAGVDYFTAAGNNSNNFYQQVFDPIAFTLPGITNPLAVNGVTSTSPYEAITLGKNPTLDFTLEWTQPFGTNKYDIGVALYSYNGTSYSLVDNYVTSLSSGDPVVSEEVSLTLSAGTYYLAFYESSSETVDHAPIAPGTFKIIFFQNSNGTIDGVNAGTGSGTSIGHELAPGVNTVAAVNVAETPAHGVATPVAEPFSSAGPGETFITAAGTTLTTAVDDGVPDFAATDGSATSVFDPFDGTSSAAPNAAAVSLLLLQTDDRLDPTQITYLLEQSAIPTNDQTTGGAGLIQANVAEAQAITASEEPIWTAQGGSTLWNNAANWSSDAVPVSTSTVTLSNGLGLFTAAYSVAFNESTATVTSLTVDGGATGGARPDLVIDAGGVLTTGTLTVGAGTISVEGTLETASGLLAGSASGTIQIDTTGTLAIGGGTDGSVITYSGIGGALVFDTTNNAELTSGLEDLISNFAAGDTLAFTGLTDADVASVIVNGTTIDVEGSSGDILAQLQLTGDFTELSYGPYGADDVEIIACYCRGTHVLTPTGEVTVENFKIGDHVVTYSGTHRPVKWIGRRSYASRFAALNPDTRPVRISKDALAEGIPGRDLWVSPGHAMFLNGMLIPAQALVNGRSVVRAETVDVVEYFHLELETHDVILAESAPSETFVDDDNRGVFHNAAEYHALYPHGPRVPARYCAPRVEEGEALEAVWQSILLRAGVSDLALTPAPGALRGHLDLVRRDRIAGWALDTALPNQPVRLRILDDDRVLGEVQAGQFRADLDRPEIGIGWHAFTFEVPAGLSPETQHLIAVRRVEDDRDLEGSPFLLAAETTDLVAVPTGNPAVWQGTLDAVTRNRIEGWAWDQRSPNTRLGLQIVVDGKLVLRILANRYRADLEAGGIGDGRHGFSVTLPHGLSPLSRHIVQVIGETDGCEIANSPFVIQAASGFDPALEKLFAASVDAVAADPTAIEERAYLLDFLTKQAERLRRLHAGIDAIRETRGLGRIARERGQAAPASAPICSPCCASGGRSGTKS